jgi:hypothetical protein
MKNKIFFSILGISLILVLVAVWNKSVDTVKGSEGISPFALKVSSEKQAYILGETVRLNFELTNEGDQPVNLVYRPDVSTGYLHLWIASDGQEFKEYNNTSWGREETGGPTLQPGQSFISQAEVLWNSKPQIPRKAKSKILTDYAFPQAGIYLIKAVVSLPVKSDSDKLTKIESEPIQITINEPVGDDLEVWNLIKDKGDIAYFLQQGGTPTFQDEKAEKLLKEVERISQKYPNSVLANKLRSTLEKFRIDEEKRKEWLEKAKQPKQP